MNRVFRTIMRCPIQLLILFILPLGISAAVVHFTPRQYQSEAMLLALHRFDILSATSIDNADLATPAETQATTLSELLATRSFDIAVGQDAHLDATLDAATRANPQQRDDAIYADISAHVLTQALGYNLFSITYTNTNPQVAQQVVAAVVHHYGLASQSVVANEGQNLLPTYQTQLAQAQNAAQSATAAEQTYIQAHPGITQTQLQSDPQYQQLVTQAQQAQQNVQNLQAIVTSLQQDISTHVLGAQGLYQVIDSPVASDKPLSQLKSLMLAGGIGLAIALLACTAFILLVMRRDQTIYSLRDLQKITTHAVVMELPQLSSRTVSQVISQGAFVEIVDLNGKGGKQSR